MVDSGESRPMSELTLTLLRLGFLALLWVLVLSIVLVLRTDLYGTQVTRRVTRSAGAATVPPRGEAPRPSRPDDEGLPNGPRTLVVTEGSLQGTTLALGTATILIGRAPECTLVLEDDYSSNRHARLTFHQGTWLVEDLGSTNGTYLGRTRVQAPTPVEPGVPVRVGRTVLELRR
jgi:pSer/pThr/pTyr-binding forkhead associated (FHA) protein